MYHSMLTSISWQLFRISDGKMFPKFEKNKRWFVRSGHRSRLDTMMKMMMIVMITPLIYMPFYNFIAGCVHHRRFGGCKYHPNTIVW